jgi:DNA polymerase-3 subunit epsilon
MTPRSAHDELRESLRRSLRDCVVVDCETTGLDPDSDRIIEIAALRVREGRPVALFHRLVDPGRPIPEIITSLTGLTHRQVRQAPPVDDVLGELSHFLAHDTVVGHNVGFDLAFIDAGINATHSAPRAASLSLCTAETARSLVPRSRVGRYRLQTLADAFDLAHRPTHRTVSDVLATLDLLHYLCGVSESG